MLYTTRNGASHAIAAMPINGIGVRVVGWVVYRYGRSDYKLIKPGDMECRHDKFFHSLSDVMNFLFPA